MRPVRAPRRDGVGSTRSPPSCRSRTRTARSRARPAPGRSAPAWPSTSRSSRARRSRRSGSARSRCGGARRSRCKERISGATIRGSRLTREPSCPAVSPHRPWLALPAISRRIADHGTAAAAPSGVPSGRRRSRGARVRDQRRQGQCRTGAGPQPTRAGHGRARALERHGRAGVLRPRDPEGDGPDDRARDAGYLRHAAAWRIGEVLLWSRGEELTAAHAVELWLASPSHRQRHALPPLPRRRRRPGRRRPDGRSAARARRHGHRGVRKEMRSPVLAAA